MKNQKPFLIVFVIILLFSSSYYSLTAEAITNQNMNVISQRKKLPNSINLSNKAINLTYPQAKYLTSIDHYYGIPCDIFLQNNLSYVITDSGDLLVFNLTDAKLEIVGVWKNRILGSEIDNPIITLAKIVVHYDRAYLGLGSRGLVILDVSKPSSPKLLEYHQEIKCSDLAIHQDHLFVYYKKFNPDIEKVTIYHIVKSSLIFICKMIDDFLFIREVIHNYGYICTKSKNTTKIFQIGENEEVTKIAEISYQLNMMVIWNNLLIGSSSDYHLWFMNITDFTKPIILSDIDLSPYYQGGIIFEGTISGELFYIWNRWYTITIDFSNVLNPKILGDYYINNYHVKLLPLKGFKETIDERLMLYMKYKSGLFLYNFTTPNNPSFYELYTDICHPSDMVAKNNLLLVSFNQKLEIYSTSKAQKPTLLSVYESQGNILDIEISDNHVFLAIGNAGIEIVNILDFENPQRVSHFNNFTINHQSNSSQSLSFNPKKKVLFITRENSGIAILDVGDYTNPFLIKEFNPNIYGTTEKAIYHSERLYVGTRGSDWGLGSFIVYDIRDPNNPIVLSEMIVDSAREFYIDGEYLYLTIGNYMLPDLFSIYKIKREINHSSHIYSEVFLGYITKIYVKNNIAFLINMTHSQSDLTIMDVHDKKNPKIVNKYPGQLSSSYLVNVIIDNELLYINEGWNGIQIFSIEKWNHRTINLKSISFGCFIIMIYCIVFIQKKTNHKRKKKKLL